MGSGVAQAYTAFSLTQAFCLGRLLGLLLHLQGRAVQFQDCVFTEMPLNVGLGRGLLHKACRRWAGTGLLNLLLRPPPQPAGQCSTAPGL